MKRYVLAAVIFVSLLLLSPPASARRLRAFRANVISPRATYRNGFYRNPRLRYRPYATYYSYPRELPGAILDFTVAILRLTIITPGEER